MRSTVFLLALVAGAACQRPGQDSPDQPGRRPPLAAAPGLEIVDVVVGTGAEAGPGKTLSMHYAGRLTSGAQFDSSYPRGAPIEFVLGNGSVIPGWDHGVRGMRVGGKRRLTVPPALAYGDRGHGRSIPPNATLVFDVELVAVK